MGPLLFERLSAKRLMMLRRWPACYWEDTAGVRLLQHVQAQHDASPTHASVHCKARCHRNVSMSPCWVAYVGLYDLQHPAGY